MPMCECEENGCVDPQEESCLESPTMKAIRSGDIFAATMSLEGACGYYLQDEDEVSEALQLLIDTGVVWSLQGTFGRMAMDYINAGLCHQ